MIKSIESLRGEDTFVVIDDDLFRALFPDPDDGEGWRMSRLDVCALFPEDVESYD